MGTFNIHSWLVVCATFVVGFMVDGIQFSFGLLLIELLDTFDKGRASTAIIGSIITGVIHLIAPVAGLMSEKYGCRIVVIAGSLICALGFFVSVFMDELVYLYVTYGFLGGLGFGLMYLPATVCLMQHFEKHRATANGIAMCGSGAGTFAFNNLTGFLLEQYGFRGTMMVQAGILLNGVVCGLILVSPPTQKKDPPLGHQDTRSPTRDVNADSMAIPPGDDDSIVANGSHDSGAKKIYEISLCCVESNHVFGGNSTSHGSDAVCQSKAKDVQGSDSIDKYMGGKVKESDRSSFGTQSIHREYQNGIITATKTEGNSRFEKSLTDIADVNANNENISIRNESEQSQRSMSRRLCDISLLKNRKLLAMLLSVFFVALAFPVPFNFIPDQAVENGMTKRQAYWLASSMGITNIISRLLIGWISDRKFVNKLVLLECLLVAVGAATILSILLESFAAKMIYTCIYGFLVGGYVVVNYVVTADLFGVQVVARSLGLVMFTIGVASLASSPIAGGLYDTTGSYEVTFVVTGSAFLIGACILPLPFVVEKLCTKKKSYKMNSDLQKI